MRSVLEAKADMSDLSDPRTVCFLDVALRAKCRLRLSTDNFTRPRALAWGAIAPGTYIEWGPAVTDSVTFRE